jgi:hypothetical protein
MKTTHLRTPYRKGAIIGGMALVLLGCCGAIVPQSAAAQNTRGGLEVCGRPSDRCNSPQKEFAPYELAFRLPKRLDANVSYESAPFYAVVILRERDPGCDGGEYTKSVETARRAAQKRFTSRKVFADHQCPDMGAVYYTPVGGPKPAENTVEAFVAVYAGKTEKEAQTVLKTMRTWYPKAVLQRMKVGYSRIVQ